MALAPGHLLGQFIGNVLEAAIQPYLQDLADRHDLSLDVHGDRPGVREGKKLTWTDDLASRFHGNWLAGRVVGLESALELGEYVLRWTLFDEFKEHPPGDES